jgi:hypothetical protein
MHTNTGRQTRQKLREPLQRAQRLYFFYFISLLFCSDHRVCEVMRTHFSFLFTPFFEDFSAAQPFLLQQVNNQLVHDFLSQQNNRLFFFLSELMDLFVAGRDQSAADQPNNLAECHPPL